MAIQSTAAISACNHSNHLFREPLCKEQTRLKKIAHVAFHILTLGIPLAMYRIISCCFPKWAQNKTNHVDLGGKAVETVQQNTVQQNIKKPFSKTEAIEFAKAELEKRTGITTDVKAFENYNTGAKLHQPVNQEIARMTNMYLDNHLKTFYDALEQNANDPWNKEEVINAAAAYMKVAYAIGCLSLDDLPAFTKDLSDKGIVRSNAEALVRPDSYLYRTFFYCTNAYHQIRGAYAWIAAETKLDFPSGKVSSKHADLFYKEGTTQNTLRLLYNEYCDRVRVAVNEDELRKVNDSFVNWTQKDTGSSTFCCSCGPQPT